MSSTKNPYLLVQTKYDPSATPDEINKMIIKSMEENDRDGLERTMAWCHHFREQDERAIQRLTEVIIPPLQRDFEKKRYAVRHAQKAAKKSKLDITAPKIDDAELTRLQTEWSMAASSLARNKSELKEAKQSVRNFLESIRIISKFLGIPMRL